MSRTDDQSDAGHDGVEVDVEDAFEAERPRLLAVAARVLGDPVEAEDVVQQAWLRLAATQVEIDNLPAWLTTVTTRLCLDRLRRRIPLVEPGAFVVEGAAWSGGLPGPSSHASSPDPAERVALAETVGVALHVVLDRLTPGERVAFVLYDSFGFDFATVAAVLETTPVAARKLASRARAKVRQPAPEEALADGEVVDAFLAAARGGDLRRLLELLAPDAVVTGDAAAVAVGTPREIVGREAVASFFDGAAASALPVLVDGRPGAAWFDRGRARVAFDFTVEGGVVRAIEFRADPGLLASLVRRRGAGQPGTRRSHPSRAVRRGDDQHDCADPTTTEEHR